MLDNDAIWNYGTGKAAGLSVYPIIIAAYNKKYKVVDLLSEYPHSLAYFTLAMHYTTANMLNSTDSETRKNMGISSKKLQAKIVALKSELNSADKKLTLEDANILTWQESFEKLFGEEPCHKDEHPNDKDAAIRHALASMHQLLSNPKECLP